MQIPDEVVNGHPACRLALELAGRLTRRPRGQPLLALLIARLEGLPREQMEKDHREDLLDRAYWMLDRSAFWAAGQLVTDYERADRDVGDSRPGEEYRALKPHLDELLEQLRGLSPSRAASLLEENLFQSLKLRNGSFAPLGF